MISFVNPKSPFRLRQALLAYGPAPVVRDRIDPSCTPRRSGVHHGSAYRGTIAYDLSHPTVLQTRPTGANPGQYRTCPGHRLLRCPGSADIVRPSQNSWRLRACRMDPTPCCLCICVHLRGGGRGKWQLAGGREAVPPLLSPPIKPDQAQSR